MIADGWAVVQDGEINVRTVSPRRRGAIVNWLYTVAHVPVLDHFTDEQIEHIWQRASKHYEATVIEVEIREK